MGPLQMKNKFSNEEGICTVCGEYTNVMQPCCGQGVNYQDAILFPEDFQFMHDTELKLFGKVEPLRKQPKLMVVK